MRRLLGLLWPHRRRVAIGLLALLAVDLAQLGIPWLIQIGIDDVAAGRGERLAGCAAGIAGIALLMVALRFAWRWCLIGGARLVRRDLRAAVFARLLRLPLPWHERRGVGDLLAVAGNDLDAVAMALGLGVMAACDAAILIVCAIAALLWIDAELALLALSPLPLVAALTWTSGRRIHAAATVVQDAFGALSEAQRATLVAARAVKGAGREAEEAARLAQANAAHADAVRAQAEIAAPLEPALALVAGLSWLLALWAGGDAVLAGRLRLGEFVAFAAYLALLTWPMLAVGWVVNIAARGRAGMDRIAAVLDAPLPVAGTQALAGTPPALALDAVASTWPGAASPALSAVSAAIPSGGMLGVIGPTGGGKSTLLRLIAGLEIGRAHV